MLSSSEASLAWSGQDLVDNFLLGVIAKRSYQMCNGSLVPHPSAVPTIAVEAQLGTHRRTQQIVIHRDSDHYAFLKPFTDVVLIGSAHAPKEATTSLETALRIGDLVKRVRVDGDRQLRVRQNGDLEATAPEPFTTMPLSWTRAYGGRDEAAEALLYPNRAEIAAETNRFSADELSKLGAVSYPRNRLGRGFFIDVDRARLDGELLPNLMDPDDPVRPNRLLASDPDDWTARPMAGGYEAVDPLTFPRSFLWGLGPVAVTEGMGELRQGALGAGDLTTMPIFPRRDPRAFNAAAPGLGIARLKGNEKVTLWHLSARAEVLELGLPAERPQILIEPPGTRTFELDPVLGTVLIEPDEERVTMTWTGALPVAAPYRADQCEEMRHAVVWK